MRHTTLNDIAKRLGISRVHVSRAINNKPDVHPLTRAKVLKMANKMGYRPNLVATSLRLRKTRTIGIVATNINNPFYASVLAGAVKKASKRGYSIILANTNEDPSLEREELEVMISKRVDGILITPVGTNNIQSLRETQVPFVVFGRYFDLSLKGLNYVGIDDEKGGFLATTHLLEKGHRRILFLNAPHRFLDAKRRLEGYKRALRKHGLAFDEDLVVEMDRLTLQGAYHAMKRALSQLKFTAALVFSDYFAFGVVKAIYEVNLDIPRDIAVVGYDDIELTLYLKVPLTTVAAPKSTLGEKAADVLIDAIEKKTSAPARHVLLEPSLLIREST